METQKNEITIIRHEGKEIKLSENAIYQLEILQHCFDFDNPEENGGVDYYVNDIHELQDYMIKQMDYIDSTKEEFLQVLQTLHYLKEFFESFRIPATKKISKRKNIT